MFKAVACNSPNRRAKRDSGCPTAALDVELFSADGMRKNVATERKVNEKRSVISHVTVRGSLGQEAMI
jgi:hypothetical protein